MKSASERLRTRSFHPHLEALETRLTPATYTVNTLADSGAGSLRAAITGVNSDSTPDEIDFSVAGVIQLTSGALPVVTNSVKINGASAPDFANVPLVEVDNNGFAGLRINAPSSSLVSMSIVNANGDGVMLGASSITVTGNYIGLALDGTTSAGNQGNGVVVLFSGVTIGGTMAGAGNVISGNALNGILVQNPTTTGTVIQGNFIGTNAAGSAAVANTLDGILFQTTGSATIGGSNLGAGNLISGNKNNGVEISGLLQSPKLVALTNGGTGTLPASAYFYVVTAATAQGETPASNEQTITLATPGSVNLSWAAVPGATSYKVYRGTTAGQQNVLVATVFTPANTLNDTGAPTTPGTPPVNNTAVVTGLAPSAVQGNKIGTDITGTSALGNLFDGVQINQMPGATIGGTTSGARNLISGNGGAPDSGIGIHLIGASITGTVIQGNFIGTDVSGALPLGNAANGILLQAAVNNTIGGTSAGAGNVISANAFAGSDEAGINLTDHANNNTIAGNLIGTDVTGLVKLGNGGAGVRIAGGSSNNTVGGTTAAQRNIISGNGFGPFGSDAGVVIGGVNNVNVPDQAHTNVIAGNFIGLDITGGKALGNCLAGVAILNGPYDNTIGGTGPGAGNVISGNSGEIGSGVFGDGVLIENALGNSVSGNRIGVDVTGQFAVPNSGNGVDLYVYTSAIIGAPGAGNIISGNGLSGVYIHDFTSNQNAVRGNIIGLNAAGVGAIPNQRFGVEISGGELSQIGGTTAGAGNVISGNLAGGVSISALFAPPLFANPVLGFGGALPAGTYYYVITAITPTGETTASAERTITLAGPGAVVLNWIAAAYETSGITGYKIYRGTSPGAENVLVANVAGVAVTTITDAGAATTPGTPPQTNTALSGNHADRNSIQGNTIGLNSAGTAPIPNLLGVLVVEATGTSIGLYDPSGGNVISGNLGDGIRISGSNATGNSVFNNFIGTGRDANTPFLNGASGVVFAAGASSNSVASNVIRNNAQDGVLVESGSTIIPISSNSMFNNGKLGIELQPGANQNQPAPVITLALSVQGGTAVQGTVTGQPNSILTVELFASPSAPSTGPGQGLTSLRQFDVRTDASGNSFFSVPLSGASLAGQFITATSTSKGSAGRSSFLVNTSEFSTGVVVLNNPLASLTTAMYQDVLGRPASQSDVDYWSAQLNSGVSRLVLTRGLWESAEHRKIQVDEYYRHYLTHLDFAGEAYWGSQMQAGVSETAVQVAFLASTEFIQAHAPINDYVIALYQYVLKRNPIPAEALGWIAAGTAGFPRAQMAQAFLTSPEANADLLNTYYPEFLNRAPDPAGAAFFLNALGNGSVTPESLAETVLASDEYFARATES